MNDSGHRFSTGTPFFACPLLLSDCTFVPIGWLYAAYPAQSTKFLVTDLLKPSQSV